MKVLVLTQYFFPETFRINEVVRSLKALASSVTVLTGQPNYPEGITYSGYRWWGCSRKNENGLDVIRVPLLPRRGSKLFLTVNYISFVFFAFLVGGWITRNDKFDVIFCYAPSPLIQALPGIWFSKFFDVPFILNVQDLWPQSVEDAGKIKNKLLLFCLTKLVTYIYQNSDLILVSSRPFVEDIAMYVSDEKIFYLPNSVVMPNLGRLEPANRLIAEAFNWEFTCVFTGNLGRAQALEVIAEAAVYLREHPRIRLILFGSGSRYRWLESYVINNSLSNLILMGRHPIEEMGYVMSRASCLLLSLRDTKIFRLTVPNKLQAYMAAGRPIIGSIGGEGARLIEDSGAGFACAPGDPKALANAILHMYNLTSLQRRQMGEAAKKYFDENFDHDILMSSLVKHFNNIRTRR